MSESADTPEHITPVQVLRSGTHIARYTAVKKQQDVYEAQVFVRLAHEPELAETYIPVGLFGSHREAMTNAQQRAERALQEHEF